jgi:DNA-binding response OmpR family regulator
MPKHNRDVVVTGRLSVDLGSKVVRVGKRRELPVAPRQFKLLRVLCLRKGQAMKPSSVRNLAFRGAEHVPAVKTVISDMRRLCDLIAENNRGKHYLEIDHLGRYVFDDPE